MEHRTEAGEGLCWCCPRYDENDLGERVCIHNQFSSGHPPHMGEVIH